MTTDQAPTHIYSNIPIPDPSIITSQQIEFAKTDLRREFGLLSDQLKAYFADKFIDTDLRYQQRFDAQQKAVGDALIAAEKAVNTALASADRAVVKAETAAEKRFEAVNEFRATLSDQALNLLPRSEADARFNAITEKLNTASNMVSREEHTTMVNSMIALSSEQKVLGSTMVRREDLKPLNEAIDKLRDFNSSISGKSSATTQITSWSIAGIAVLVSIISFVYNSSNHQQENVAQIPYSSQQADAQLAGRIDALSQRLGSLTSPVTPYSAPQGDQLLTSRLDSLSQRLNMFNGLIGQGSNPGVVPVLPVQPTMR